MSETQCACGYPNVKPGGVYCAYHFRENPEPMPAVPHDCEHWRDEGRGCADCSALVSNTVTNDDVRAAWEAFNDYPKGYSEGISDEAVWRDRTLLALRRVLERARP